MAAPTDRYEHTPLDLSSRSIRLLKITARQSDKEPIRCTVYTAVLEPDLQFCALSYAWDEPSANGILINDKQFEIRDNLFSFLSTESLDTGFCEELPIWIDQICMYSYQTVMKHLGNLRFEPLFSEGFDFAYLVSPIPTHGLIWAPWSWFGILYNQEPVYDPEPLPGEM
jgi:hypothetical protein